MEKFKKSLELTENDDGTFSAINLDFGFGRIYGGQILAQSLKCAYEGVDADRFANSLHGFFLQMGNVNKPIIFKVKTLRRGQSITVREVLATQDTKEIFFMSVSFKAQETGVVHGPKFEKYFADYKNLKDETHSYHDLLVNAQASPHKIFFPESLFYTRTAPFLPDSPLRVWLKFQEKTSPADIRFNQCLLAFASDAGILLRGLQQHGLSFRDQKVKIASLDHAMWFVAPCSFDDWIMFEITSPYAHDSRMFGQGIMCSSTHMLAQVNQEGLVRLQHKAASI